MCNSMSVDSRLKMIHVDSRFKMQIQDQDADSRCRIQDVKMLQVEFLFEKTT